MKFILASEALGNLLLSIWAEPSGKIFILSVAYYLFSALVFSGYISFFAGGYSGIPFGNFSLGDLLFFFPTMAVSLIGSIFDNFWRWIWRIIYKIIIPTFLGFLSSFGIYVLILDETPLLWTLHIFKE